MAADGGMGGDGMPWTRDELMRVAGLLDRAAAESSSYRRFVRARSLILGPSLVNDAERLRSGPGDITEDAGGQEDEWAGDDGASKVLPLLESAAWAAMRYRVVFSVEANRERVRLEPHFKGPDSTDPPDVEGQTKDVVDAWTALAKAVSSPGAQATMSHLVFQAVGGREYAKDAAVAYIELSEIDERAADIVLSARAAVRLSRAVGDGALGARALAALERAAEACVVGERPSAAAAQSALGTLVRESSPRVRELLDGALAAWGPASVGHAFWGLKLQTSKSEADRRQIWRDRVASATAAAEASDSNILKAARLRDVLALAEASGLEDLRRQASVLVQNIRNMDLEMMRIRVSSHRFEEQFEEMVASVLNDPSAGDFTWMPETDHIKRPGAEEEDGATLPTWYTRLRAFARHGPPTGDPEQNRAQVRNQHRLAPLQHLFPVQLQTPEGLPLYAPSTEDERFDLDMVKWETELLGQWAFVYAEALHRVVAEDMPTLGHLAGVLSEDASPSPVGRQLAESFYRYWTGDGAAALHTAVPMIEALVRNAVVRADRGVFRLQRNQAPGQYVGLGALLPEFYDVYHVSEEDQRFFNAVLRHPGGWNLRNLLSHGYLPSSSGGGAAMALYAALRVLVLSDDEASGVRDTDSGDPRPP